VHDQFGEREEKSPLPVIMEEGTGNRGVLPSLSCRGKKKKRGTSPRRESQRRVKKDVTSTSRKRGGLLDLEKKTFEKGRERRFFLQKGAAGELSPTMREKRRGHQRVKEENARD